MKKMRKSASNVNNAVNLISGAYTLPLIDKLFSNSQRIENMDDVYFAITALVDTDRISEAFHMIRGLFGISAPDPKSPRRRKAHRMFRRRHGTGFHQTRRGRYPHPLSQTPGSGCL